MRCALLLVAAAMANHNAVFGDGAADAAEAMQDTDFSYAQNAASDYGGGWFGGKGGGVGGRCRNGAMHDVAFANQIKTPRALGRLQRASQAGDGDVERP